MYWAILIFPLALLLNAARLRNWKLTGDILAPSVALFLYIVAAFVTLAAVSVEARWYVVAYIGWIPLATFGALAWVTHRANAPAPTRRRLLLFVAPLALPLFATITMQMVAGPIDGHWSGSLGSGAFRLNVAASQGAVSGTFSLAASDRAFSGTVSGVMIDKGAALRLTHTGETEPSMILDVRRERRHLLVGHLGLGEGRHSIRLSRR